MTQFVPHTQKTNERKKKKINVLNTNQRTLKKIISSKTSVTEGRIFFKNKLFVPDVGKLNLRFIKKIQDPIEKQAKKTKTYEIFNNYYYWPNIIYDFKRFSRNCYGCKQKQKLLQ